MKIVDANVGEITNIEVLHVLQENKTRYAESWKGIKKDLHAALSIEEQVTNYLTKSAIGNTTTETAKLILKQLSEYDIPFKKNDVLQFLNTLPKELVELYLIMDSSTMAELEAKELTTKMLEDLAEILSKNE